MLNMARIILLSFLLTHLAQAAGSSKRPVCVNRAMMPHEGVPVPFSASSLVKVPLRIHEPCSKRRQELPLLLLLSGALVRPFEYSMLANVLARNGFIVAIPQYSRDYYNQTSPITDRARDFILSTREMGYNCPRNGQFVTVRLINSMLNFFIARNGGSGKMNIADLGKTVLFGHSLGGFAGETFFNDYCANFTAPIIPPPTPLGMNPELLPRLGCEQFKPMRMPGVRVRGLITYEGFRNTSMVTANSETFYVAIHSPFYDSRVDVLRNQSQDGNLAIVRVREANHFGPTNYVRENEFQRTVCAFPRPPPEDKFKTTPELQKRVVKSVARTVMMALEESINGGGMEGLRKLERKRRLLVDSVEVY